MYSTGISSRLSSNKTMRQQHQVKRKDTITSYMPDDLNVLNKTNTTNFFNFYYLNLRVRLNISGKIFEIHEYLLDLFPLSLLGCEAERLKFYDSKRDEFFFDRNREAFEGVLQFYQTNGAFEVPYFVPVDTFYEEIRFFRLDNYLDSSSKCDESLLITALQSKLKDLKKKLSNKSLSEDSLNELMSKKRQLKN